MNTFQHFFDTYKTAVFEKNADAFLSIFDSELRNFDTWEQWSYEGMTAWREMVTEWFNSLGNERVVVEFDDIRTSASDTLAMATAFVSYAAISVEGKKLRSLQSRLTWVFQKKDDSWKIIHEHNSVPVDGTLKAILARLETVS